jgi:hypothetical protein
MAMDLFPFPPHSFKIVDKTIIWLDYSECGGCLIRNRSCLLFVSTWVHPLFLLDFACLRYVSCVQCYMYQRIVHCWLSFFGFLSRLLTSVILIYLQKGDNNKGVVKAVKLVLHGTKELPDHVSRAGGSRIYDEHYNKVINEREVTQ